MDKNHLLNYVSKEYFKQIIERKNPYLKACMIITTLFKDKVDKAGHPYIGHLYRVANGLKDPIEKVAGLLHDVVEDTDVTLDDLLEVGFTQEVVDIVSIVTHEKIDKSNMSKEEKLELYNKEIDKVINSGNIHAIRLKEADMSDNFDPIRLKELPKEKQEWFNEKYGKQLIKLRNVKGR